MMRFSWLAVLAGICLPFALGGAALADHHGGGTKQSVSGTVTSVDATTSSFVVQVQGDHHRSTSVTVDSSASTTFSKVTGHQSVTATFAGVAIGEQVEAQGSKNADGSLAAAKVTIRVPVAQVHGSVASVTGDTFVVTPSGPQGAAVITVHTSATTQFFKNDHSAASLSDVAVGVPVEAGGTLNADGSIQALVVVLDLIKHAEGTISAINTGAQSFTLHPASGADLTVDVTASTRIRKISATSAAGATGTFADLAVGDRVAVDGTANADGSLTATQVLDAGQPKVARSGTVASLTADGFVVTVKGDHGTTTQVTVHTNAGTQFFKNDRSPATLADVVVGATVQVVGTQNADGSVLASTVVIDLVQHYAGIITAVNTAAQSFTLHPASGADVTVDVTANTIIHKIPTPGTAPAASGSFSDLQVGDGVDVDGTLNADGSVTASQVLDTGAPRVVGTGTVASLTADGFVLTVKGDHGSTSQVTVHTDASTTFVKGDNTPATLADVLVGATVTLLGTRNVDGSVHAAIVNIALPKPAVTGKVANVSASGFTVTPERGSDVVVTVTGTTTYHKADGSTAQFSDVTAGVGVSVRGTVNMDGSVTATDVVIYPAHAH